MKSFTRRAALVGAGAAAGAAGWAHLGGGPADLTGTEPIPAAAEGFLNDASNLSLTPVASHKVLEPATEAELVAALRGEIRAARSEGRPVAVGAARHSMGGQSLPRDGHALSLRHHWLAADPAAGSYRVAAGARWSEVIRALDAIGFSPKVMQSNSDFGVAATLGVNAHGWPVPFGPAVATARRIRLVTADGAHLACTRDENAELFRLTMGGYGLVGIMTEVELDMVLNLRLDPSFARMPAAELGRAFDEAITGDPAIRMAYGRMNLARRSFFTEALLVTYRPAEDQADLPAAAGSGLLSRAARPIFRVQPGNEAAKTLRWALEAGLLPAITGPATRNSLMNEPVVTLDDRDPERTDILHEYFVPATAFAGFVALCRRVIPGSYQELLNVTLRHVGADADSLMPYAPAPRIAAVMLFSQEMTARAEADMQRMTRALIDGVLDLGGSYYLPYRPHATPDQFARAYPRAAEFAAAKRRLDPGLTFRNNFWDTYLAKL